MPEIVTLDRVADFTDAERAAVRALTESVYPPEEYADWPGLHIEWSTPEWCVRVRDGEALLSYVGVYLREAECGGQPVLIGGIGGVKTHPAARGRGLAAKAIRRAVAFFAEQGVGVGLLVCAPHLIAYYARLGWREFAGRLIVRQRGERADFTLNRVMTLPVGEEAPAEGAIDLCGPPW